MARSVAEAYHRDLAEGFLSTYDGAKFRAHEVAEEADRSGGAPIVVRATGRRCTGRATTSELGNDDRADACGGRMPLIPFPARWGSGFVYVDDVADGILLAFLPRHTLGESYVLSGDRVLMK